MSDVVVKIENLSKQYRLGTIGTGTLSHDLNRFWAKLNGKSDPYQVIGDVNDRSVLGSSDYVWALSDISFQVNRGEVFGIVGKNGAGKSTLLKILSRITTPTTGSAKMKGRVGSLLEVGTGFHPELTGRENVYLNGAILGMRKWEISQKLDEIIEFSGVKKYIDTPVKRYSSGMKVRLGFAVAAHLEPEILIVDEVLAVGDFEFQNRCIGKMQQISSEHGRTVLFVSHNLNSVKALCSRVAVIENGKLKSVGPTELELTNYLKEKNRAEFSSDLSKVKREKSDWGKTVYFKSVNLVGEDNKVQSSVFLGEKLKFLFGISSHEELSDISCVVAVQNVYGDNITVVTSDENNFLFSVAPGAETRIEMCLGGLILNSGEYKVRICLRRGKEILDLIQSALVFNVEEVGKQQVIFQEKLNCYVRDMSYWRID